jgi:hypothetical protein
LPLIKNILAFRRGLQAMPRFIILPQGLHGKTLFSFAMPPFENKIDLYEKALVINKHNNKDTQR